MRLIVVSHSAQITAKLTNVPLTALASLAKSMRAYGQLELATVGEADGLGMHPMIHGERRCGAAKLAGVSTIECQVLKGGASEKVYRRLSEELSRETLSPIVVGRLAADMMRLRRWSQRRISREFDCDHTQLSKARKLLRLPKSVQELVLRGRLRKSTASAILKNFPESKQQAIAERAVREGLTCKQTEALAKPKRAATGKSPRLYVSVYRVLGDCEVVVKVPAGSPKKKVREALRAACKEAGR